MSATKRRGGYRSLFWPIVLISAGVISLLGNMGVISAANLVTLFRLWPLLLIVIGLDLLFGRSSPVIGGLIGIGAVVVVIAVMLLFPADLNIETASYTAPLQGAESMQVEISPAVSRLTVNGLSDSNDVFTAEAAYFADQGEPEFETSGETERTIALRQPNSNNPLGWLPGFFVMDELAWEVGLSSRVAVDLTINSGVGVTELNLGDLNLTGLRIQGGTGEIRATLPNSPAPYTVEVNGGVGELDLTVLDGAGLNINISGGVGDVTVDVPDGAAVRVTADTGVGSVSVPGALARVGGSDDSAIGESGEWETDNYASAEPAERITIDFNGGVGSLHIR